MYLPCLSNSITVGQMKYFDHKDIKMSDRIYEIVHALKCMHYLMLSEKMGGIVLCGHTVCFVSVCVFVILNTCKIQKVVFVEAKRWQFCVF